MLGALRLGLFAVHGEARGRHLLRVSDDGEVLRGTRVSACQNVPR